jgi:hypothetical protein
MASSNGANGSVADAAKAGAIVVEEAADSSGKIPAAVFFEDVPAASEKYGAEALIEQLSELAQKYRLCVLLFSLFVSFPVFGPA